MGIVTEFKFSFNAFLNLVIADAFLTFHLGVVSEADSVQFQRHPARNSMHTGNEGKDPF
jgi:hypothetical protein